jgi:hypothetical protein
MSLSAFSNIQQVKIESEKVSTSNVKYILILIFLRGNNFVAMIHKISNPITNKKPIQVENQYGAWEFIGLMSILIVM